MLVVIINQPLGVVHSNRWLKYAISKFLRKNVRNNKKIEVKFSKKWVIEFAPKCWLSVLKEAFDINKNVYTIFVYRYHG